MPRAGLVDPTPLTPAQIRALGSAVARELSWGRWVASREMRRWLRLAALIPDTPLREDAFASLTRKRGHADGAALFAVLARPRAYELVRLLVAFETIWDFLDSVSERHPAQANGRQLHLALVDAVDLHCSLSDYYALHPWSDDGGYLESLVNACREGCHCLPSYALVRRYVVREAWRAHVAALNHEIDSVRRDDGLRRWAAEQFPDEQELCWFELSGAASASLVAHVLLALAADEHLEERDVVATYRAYWPWISLATTMLDSYADQAEDAASGNHSYIAHYRDGAVAVRRLKEAIARSAHRALRLRDGHKHAVIFSCMVALYLSKDSARAPDLRTTTAELARAGGSLVRLLVPVLRLWRILTAQRSAT
jgi:tetraprenyl-beta-curcumene synthase